MELEALSGISLFAGLSEEEFRCSIDGETRTYEAGETVFSEGDPVWGFLVVLEGTLQVYRMIRGQRVVISDFTTGMTGGEVPLLSGTPHLAHGQAMTDLRLFSMSEEAFWRMLGNCPVVRQRILDQMVERNADLQIRSFQREKLVSLGTMAAGLAHELNNPASAAKRSAQALAEGLEAFNLRASAILNRYIFKEPPTEDFPFSDIQRQVLEGGEELTLLERSEREDEILDWLEDLELDDAEDLAPTLAQAGFTVDALAAMSERLIEPEVPSFLHWISKEIELRELAQNLVESTSRMSELVRAMKSYSYMDKDGETSTVDLRQGLETTLRIIGHKARRKKIRFSRHYAEDLPSITAYGSELNQVWTNLLDNAIHASEEGGRVTIRAARAESPGCVQVEIEDQGPGIPKEDQGRIFEPFFTTKGAGEGTGLGLDISYRIVTRHGGSLEVESEPGQTIFRVTLPIDGPRPDGPTKDD